MNITKFLNKVYFAPRLKEIERYTDHASELQAGVMHRLIRMAANTEWGKKYDYASIRTYEDFKKRLPIQTYEEIKPYVARLRAGEQNLLWPSEIRWFAKSSGTTNDKSKFLPVSKESLQDTHYQGGKDAVAIYLGQNPESRFFSGKGLILVQFVIMRGFQLQRGEDAGAHAGRVSIIGPGEYSDISRRQESGGGRKKAGICAAGQLSGNGGQTFIHAGL